MKRKVWRGPLTVQGQWSTDHRKFDQFRYREFPLSLQRGIYGGHDTAPAVGTIEDAALGGPGPGGGSLWWGVGYVDTTDEGMAALERIDSQSQRYVSVNPAEWIDPKQVIIDPANGNEVTQEELYAAYAKADEALMEDRPDDYAKIMVWLESLFYGYEWPDYLVGGATLVTIPCYEEARIEIIGDEGDIDLAAALAEVTGSSLPASGLPAIGSVPTATENCILDPTAPTSLRKPLWDLISRMVAAGAPMPLGREATASGILNAYTGTRLAESSGFKLTAAGGPVLMPAAAYRQRQYDGPTALTFEVTPEGWCLFFGHVVTEKDADGRPLCHITWGDRCETMPDTLDLTKWCYGTTFLDDGTKAATGIITYGGPHAGDELGNLPDEIQRRMEDIGTQLGTCCAYRDEWGVQVAGAVHVDVPSQELNRVIAAGSSGDWRDYLFFDQRWQRGELELFGVHIVNTRGFNVPRRMAASGGLRLIASAAAMEATASCGCGGHDSGSCSCKPSSSLAERLHRLALLDQTQHLRQPAG